MASQDSSSTKFSLHVTVTIAPENLAKFWEAFDLVFKAVTAEPECTYFEVYQNPEEPGEISWVEKWSKSKEWFYENQLKREYYKGYFAITEPMFIKPRVLRFLEPVSGMSYST